MRAFTLVLSSKPTNIIALLGKARIAYARKQYLQALRIFQQVLQLKPDAQPDPRIGIGLCFWAMDQKAKARACWERSLEVVSPTMQLTLRFNNPGYSSALPTGPHVCF